MNTFDSIGLKYNIDQSSSGHDYLNIYENALNNLEIPFKRLLLISGNKVEDTARAFAERYPSTHIIVANVSGRSVHFGSADENVVSIDCSKTEDILYLTAKSGPFDAIIDDGTNRKSDKLQQFKSLLYFLNERGLYVVEDLHARNFEQLNDVSGEDIWDYLARVMTYKYSKNRLTTESDKDDKSVSDAIHHISNYGKICFIIKSGNHKFKLRDHETNAVLSARYAESWGEVIIELSEHDYVSRCDLATSNPKFDHRFKSTIKTPGLFLRKYNDVTCHPRQVVTLGDFVLPDSYRHNGARRLGNSSFPDAGPHFSPANSHAASRRIEGDYYYLDTEYPGHFGHILTEVVSRLWAWDEAKLRAPTLRVLMSLPHGKGKAPSFLLDILKCFDIYERDIEYIHEKETVLVERLYCASPQLSNPLWCSAAIVETWQKISKSMVIEQDENKNRKIFISREKDSVRSCNNMEVVEDLFRANGFEVIRPEHLGYSEQVNLFANASVIAGFAGSGMFNIMHAKPDAKIIVITGETFSAMNEYLLLSAKGGSLDYVWCASDVQYPKGRWTAEAYRSNFTFSMDRDLNFVQSLLATSEPYTGS